MILPYLFMDTMNSLDPVELTQQLVRINSENYTSDEIQIGLFCSSILESLGFKIFMEPMNDRNINLIGVKLIDGSQFSIDKVDNYRFLMFSGHMDTVPGYWGANSEKAEIRESKIWGRGACDMKSGIACFLSAIHQFCNEYQNLQSQPQTPFESQSQAPPQTQAESELERENNRKNLGIIVCLTVREEIGCEGVRYIKSQHITRILKRVEYCILAEPSGNELIVGHNGYSSYLLRFHGKSAHSGTAFAGENAIYKAAKFLVDLE